MPGLLISGIAAIGMVLSFIGLVIAVANLFVPPKNASEELTPGLVALAAFLLGWFFFIGYAGWQMQLFRKPTLVYMGLCCCAISGMCLVPLAVAVWGFLVMADPDVRLAYLLEARRRR